MCTSSADASSSAARSALGSQCASARAQCAAACRCAPCTAASRAATGAQCRNAATSPAASACSTSRAAIRVASLASSACSTSRCRPIARVGVIACSTACRASSWRNANDAPSVRSTPVARHSSIDPLSAAVSSRSSQASARGPATAAASSTARAEGDRRPARASTASCTVAGTPFTAFAVAASTSVTKNGLPAVCSCKAVASTPVPARERPHRRQRERLRRQPRRAGSCQIAEHGAQRMRRCDLVVAKARDEERTGAGDAPAGVAQQIERRLVGPVHVFEHGQCRPFGEQVDEGDEQAMPLAAAVLRDGQLAARVDGDVVERAERARCRHRLAGTPVHRGVGAHRSGERSQHGGLADARFAFDEHQPARAFARLRPSRIELREQAIALEQRHGSTPRRRASATSAAPVAVVHGSRAVGAQRLARDAAVGRRWFATAYAPTLRPSSVECSSVLRKWMPANTRASSISFSICARLV